MGQKERTFMVPDKVSSQVDSGDGWDKGEVAQNKAIQGKSAFHLGSQEELWDCFIVFFFFIYNTSYQ